MSRKQLQASLRRWQAALNKAKALVARRRRQLAQLPNDSQRSRACKYALTLVGRHEDAGRPNRAGWLDSWAREVGSWMVGQPWCGLTVWKVCKHVGLTLDKRTVSTVAIRDMAKAGTGGFRHWRPWAAGVKVNPGDVLIYGTPRSGPVHTGLYVGNGKVVEGNTSPGTSGSQNNGGGIYIRTLGQRQGWILGVAVPDYKTH